MDEGVLTDKQVLLLRAAFPQLREALGEVSFIEALVYFDEFLTGDRKGYYDLSNDDSLVMTFSAFLAGWIGHTSNLKRLGDF